METQRHPFERQDGTLVCAVCGMTRGSVLHSFLGSTRHITEPEWMRRRRTTGLPAKDYTRL